MKKATGRAVELMKERLYEHAYTALYYWQSYDRTGMTNQSLLNLFHEYRERRDELRACLEILGYSKDETNAIEERARAEYWAQH